jgi:NAD(P)-dependent dehydrogenase (short-subunit alcohol dehydrogenase family)
VTRVVFITGVLGGVGRATAEAFHDAGWRVSGMDRRPLDGATGLDDFVQGDVTALDADRTIGRFLDALERLDAVVNNAAEQVERSLLDTTNSEWDRIMAANVRSAFIVSRLAQPGLARTSGAIVNVASVHAIATSTGLAAYAASKGALLALTRASAVEFAAVGIRVNAVVPGAVDTPMLQAGLSRWPSPGAARSTLERRTPLGRIGEASEIASAIVFLADGDQSSFITGQTLVADGGVLARLSSE